MGMKPGRRWRKAHDQQVSVLNREPMGMKRILISPLLISIIVSVLNREPMGMKPKLKLPYVSLET